MQHDSTTRWLHGALALGVSFQLLVSLVMEAPEPGKIVGGWAAIAFEAHQTGGLVVAALLAGHWLWTLSRHVADGLPHLFPWFSRARLGAIVTELKGFLKLRLSDEPGPLAGAIHGLGLLLVSTMAATGVTLYFGMAENGAAPPTVEAVKEIHGFLATFMWLFLGGHAGMAVLHQWLGHRTLARMFTLK